MGLAWNKSRFAREAGNQYGSNGGKTMAEKLMVKNWKKHQHYKDRSPPWIKLHGELLTDHDFACLQDASKLHLISIWLLARLSDGVIPNDPLWVKKCAGLDGEVDLSPLIEGGFLIPVQPASKPLAKCASETETETDRDIGVSPVENSSPTETAAGLAMEFHLRVPGTRKPLLPELTAEFQSKLDWLKANDRDATGHILGCIRDPKRDKTAANTIGKMWQFWKFCGLEEKVDASNSGKRARVTGGDYCDDAKTFDGSGVKDFDPDTASQRVSGAA